MEDTNQNPQQVKTSTSPVPPMRKRRGLLILAFILGLLLLTLLVAGMDQGGSYTRDTATSTLPETVDEAGAVPETSDLEAELNASVDGSIDRDMGSLDAMLQGGAEGETAY